MKNRAFFFLSALLCSVLLLPAHGSPAKEAKLWTNLCASCHDGKTAPDAALLKEKYATTDEFVAAVKKKGSRCMNILKNNEAAVQEIARELGIGAQAGK
ncbi:MAG: hypothetical protein U0411_02975 [Thermodesulfovibrionales bacterium]